MPFELSEGIFVFIHYIEIEHIKSLDKYFDTPCQKETLIIRIIINILTLRVIKSENSSDSESQNVYNNNRF